MANRELITVVLEGVGRGGSGHELDGCGTAVFAGEGEGVPTAHFESVYNEPLCSTNSSFGCCVIYLFLTQTANTKDVKPQLMPSLRTVALGMSPILLILTLLPMSAPVSVFQ